MHSTTVLGGLVTAELPRAAEWDTVGSVFRALGSPIRVGIVALLYERSRSVNDLVDALGVSQPLVSQHLRILRSSSLVCGTRRGREMIYGLTDPNVAALVVSAGRLARDQRAPRLTRV